MCDRNFEVRMRQQPKVTLVAARRQFISLLLAREGLGLAANMTFRRSSQARRNCRRGIATVLCRHVLVDVPCAALELWIPKFSASLSMPLDPIASGDTAR